MLAPDCLNCGGKPAASARFCEACGQSTTLPPLTIKQGLLYLGASLLSAEAALPRTALGLLRSPGQVAEQWIRGRRRQLAGPLAVALVVGVIAALIQEPLAALRSEHLPAGRADYTVGLTARSGNLALTLTSIALPVGLLTAPIAARLAQQRPSLEWAVLAVYCYVTGAALQLAVLAAGAVSPSLATWEPLRWIEFALPIAVLLWGAAGFGGEGRGRRVLAAGLGQTAFLATVIALVALAGPSG
ncbi:MAG: hypothetical protein AAFZ65_06840 [Planctomycetota bacterium]